jgi:hypothetical protein
MRTLSNSLPTSTSLHTGGSWGGSFFMGPPSSTLLQSVLQSATSCMGRRGLHFMLVTAAVRLLPNRRMMQVLLHRRMMEVLLRRTISLPQRIMEVLLRRCGCRST